MKSAKRRHHARRIQEKQGSLWRNLAIQDEHYHPDTQEEIRRRGRWRKHPALSCNKPGCYVCHANKLDARRKPRERFSPAEEIPLTETEE